MPLKTTTIGAFPKPDYVPTPDWFASTTDMANPTKAYQAYLNNLPSDIEQTLDRATQAVVKTQVDLGIDIPTDGEVRRENYIYYQCREFSGFDFKDLTKVSLRNGVWQAEVPTVVGDIKAGRPLLPRDYQVAQAATTNPVKITLPGPLTIMGSTADNYYNDPVALGVDLAKALNQEVLALVEAGCTWIQIDEPVFARNPQQALTYGFDHLEQCFASVPDDVNKVIHICCGYPNALDDHDYEKADRNAYFELAQALDDSSINVVSLEDAHAHNDLNLLTHFTKTSVIWGSVTIASSKIESVEIIRQRLDETLKYIDADRLIVGPDCGLGFLTDELMQTKLKNMVEAARQVG